MPSNTEPIPVWIVREVVATFIDPAAKYTKKRVTILECGHRKGRPPSAPEVSSQRCRECPKVMTDDDRREEMRRLIRATSTQNSSGCWIWNGPRHEYGRIGKKQKAHRVSYEAFVGKIPAGMWILHSCDTPACVNPKHLRAGDRDANAEDRVQRRRVPQRHSDELILKVRSMLASGVSQGKTAKALGVQQSYVSRVNAGKFRRLEFLNA